MSLETAAKEDEDGGVALAIQRSLEDDGLGSGVDFATSAASSSSNQTAGELRSGGERLSRPLQRRDAMVDMEQFGWSRPLRRRDAMVDMEELLLSRSFSRLGVGDQRGLGGIVEAEDDGGSHLGLACGSVEGEGNCAHTARRASLPGD